MKFRKKFLIQIFFASLSLQIYLGAIFGYFFAKFLSKRIQSIILEFKNWKLHLHHWIFSFLVLILAFIFDFLSQFSLGILGGIIFQGIYCYSDWHKILIKNTPSKWGV
jgi:predicted Na+-dependent transporter